MPIGRSRRAGVTRAVGAGLLLAALALPACTSADGTGDAAGPGATTTLVQGDGTFPGDYRLRGNNPDGSRYRGTLTIDGAEDGALALDWDTNGSYEGVGVAADGVLAATHGNDGDPCNAALYPIAPTGRLEGRWVGYDGSGPNTEAAAAVIPGPPGVAGSYAIEGVSGDGTEYSGSMDIVASGAAFEVVRQVGGFLSRGSAMLIGADHLAVGFGAENCAVVAYRMRPDGHLAGKWGAEGVQTPGREEATPD